MTEWIIIIGLLLFAYILSCKLKSERERSNMYMEFFDDEKKAHKKTLKILDGEIKISSLPLEDAYKIFTGSPKGLVDKVASTIKWSTQELEALLVIRKNKEKDEI